MSDFIQSEDLDVINRALRDGADVRIQLTKTGARIIRDDVTVLRKKVLIETGDNKKRI